MLELKPSMVRKTRVRFGPNVLPQTVTPCLGQGSSRWAPTTYKSGLLLR